MYLDNRNRNRGEERRNRRSSTKKEKFNEKERKKERKKERPKAPCTNHKIRRAAVQDVETNVWKSPPALRGTTALCVRCTSSIYIGQPEICIGFSFTY